MSQLIENEQEIQEISKADVPISVENSTNEVKTNENNNPVTVNSSTNEVEENEDNPSTNVNNSTNGVEENEDNLLDETRLANLLGVEDQTLTPAQNPTPDSQLPTPPSPDPHKTKTQPNLSSNPWAKLGIVGLGMFAFFIGGGLVVARIMGIKITKAPSMVEEKQTTTDEPLTATQENEEEEVGRLKTQLALESQEKQIKAVEDSRSPKTNVETVKEEPEKPIPTPTPTPQKVTNTAPPPPPPRPTPRPVSRPVARARPAPRPAPPEASPTPVFSRPVIAANPADKPQPTVTETPIDPMEQWRTLSNLGSYGSSSLTEEVDEIRRAEGRRQRAEGIYPDSAVVANLRESANSPSRIAIAQELGLQSPEEGSSRRELPRNRQMALSRREEEETPLATKQMPKAIPVASTLETTSAQINPAEEAHILNNTPIQRLQVGQQVSGQLVTPIIWADEESTLDERFVVRLDQPLIDERGRELLAAGTQVVFVCHHVHESGWVISEATALVREGTEYALPPGVISIRGQNGQPLMASYWDDGGSEIAKRDRTAFLFGALSQVGEVLNRPDVEQSTSSTGSSFSQTTTTRSGEPDILGAVLEGGFTPLTEQILQRNEQATKELLNRSKLWYVNVGSSVQVFVNQSFEL